MKFITFISLIAILVLVSGCTNSSAGGDSSANATATPTPSATVTPAATSTPVPSAANTSVGTPTPSAAPSPSPSLSATPSSNPYEKPGWPNYGVSQNFTLMQSVPTGRIYGHVYLMDTVVSPSPTAVPVPTSNYVIYATTNPDDYHSPNYASANDDGSYEITGLSYGTYSVFWVDPELSTYGDYTTVTLDATTPEALVNIYITPG